MSLVVKSLNPATKEITGTFFQFNNKFGKHIYDPKNNPAPIADNVIELAADGRDIPRIAALFTYQGQVTIPIAEGDFIWFGELARMIIANMLMKSSFDYISYLQKKPSS